MIRVQRKDFNAGQEVAELTGGRTDIGAVATFTGVVRDDGGLAAMTLEHYPGMTERALETIEAEARKRWKLVDCLVIHRYGRLVPGDNIVLVATLSTHRDAAFDAARFLMDYLKTEAPFWKREERADGARWVEARASDDAARVSWSKPEAAE